MAINNTVVIVIVVAFAFYLIYSQNNQQKHLYTQQHFTTLKNPSLVPQAQQLCHNCSSALDQNSQQQVHAQVQAHAQPIIRDRQYPQQPSVTNVVIDQNQDPYSDAVKKQDSYSMLDPLTYPQLRLPREVLEKYNEYYEKNGIYPAFGQSTQPLFDNPILNGVLIKQIDQNEPFSDNVPSSVPLFRVKSSKNVNRFFYYIIEQRYLSKLELKIPLDNVKVNGVKINNGDFYGISELYDGDVLENIPIYPNTKFKIFLYKTYSFP